MSSKQGLPESRDRNYEVTYSLPIKRPLLERLSVLYQHIWTYLIKYINLLYPVCWAHVLYPIQKVFCSGLCASSFEPIRGILSLDEPIAYVFLICSTFVPIYKVPAILSELTKNSTWIFSTNYHEATPFGVHQTIWVTPEFYRLMPNSSILKLWYQNISELYITVIISCKIYSARKKESKRPLMVLEEKKSKYKFLSNSYYEIVILPSNMN